MIPARLFIRDDQDDWLNKESLQRGGNQRSAIVRVALDALRAQIELGNIRLSAELAQRDGGS